MRRPFIGSEREDAVSVLHTTFSSFLNLPINKVVVDAISTHLRRDHNYSADEAVSEIVSLQAQALRLAADGLEEKASELLTAMKEVKM